MVRLSDLRPGGKTTVAPNQGTLPMPCTPKTPGQSFSGYFSFTTDKQRRQQKKQLTNIIPRQSSFIGRSFWGHLFLVWDKEANYENGLAGSFSFTEITKQRGRVKNFGAIKAHQHTNQHTCMDTRGTRQSFSFGFSSADPQTHLWSL